MNTTEGPGDTPRGMVKGDDSIVHTRTILHEMALPLFAGTVVNPFQVSHPLFFCYAQTSDQRNFSAPFLESTVIRRT